MIHPTASKGSTALLPIPLPRGRMPAPPHSSHGHPAVLTGDVQRWWSPFWHCQAPRPIHSICACYHGLAGVYWEGFTLNVRCLKLRPPSLFNKLPLCPTETTVGAGTATFCFSSEQFHSPNNCIPPLLVLFADHFHDGGFFFEVSLCFWPDPLLWVRKEPASAVGQSILLPKQSGRVPSCQNPVFAPLRVILGLFPASLRSRVQKKGGMPDS